MPLRVRQRTARGPAIQLIPRDPDEKKSTGDGSEIVLTGIEGSSRDREQILEVLRLNRQILHSPQSDADVDEAAVRATIDDLLDQLSNVPSI